VPQVVVSTNKKGGDKMNTIIKILKILAIMLIGWIIGNIIVAIVRIKKIVKK
jgi:hypothetical protein